MQQIGRYQIVEELGRGAMGVVYRALDPAIGRTIAIKSIRLSDLSDSSERQRLHDRLIREAQSAGILSHPNIVTIYDILEQDDLTHIFMEFVNGPSLDKMFLSGTPPSGDLLLEFFRHVANGLDYAHRRGIIHRDIKPANLMWHIDESTGERLAKITDFGVAKFASQQLTQAGVMMGTPNYMAPEQIHGADVDGRTDQFALAVVMYEALTGQKPFTADYLPTLLYRIARENEVRAEVINATLTVEIGDVLHKALAKEPAQRFETCSAFMQALTDACAGAPGWMSLANTGESSSPTIAGAFASPLAGAGASPDARVIDQTYNLPPVRERRRELEEGFPLWKKLAIAVLIFTMVAVGITVVRNYLSPEEDNKQAAQTSPQSTPAKPAEQTAPAPNETVTGNQTAPRPNNEKAAANPPPVETPQTTAPPASEQERVNTEKAARSETAIRSGTPAKEPGLPIGAGDVQFASSPVNARIVVDGDELKACNTPCTIHLQPGRHTLTAALTGYALAQRIIHVPEDSAVFLPLQESIGWVQMSSTPSGAQIFVDGKPQGQTPATVRLRAGEHQVLLVQGSQRHEQTITVHPESVQQFAFTW